MLYIYTVTITYNYQRIFNLKKKINEDKIIQDFFQSIAHFYETIRMA